jgi:hypothetical protein
MSSTPRLVLAAAIIAAASASCSRGQAPPQSMLASSTLADERTALQADREWIAALENNDPVLAATFLDPAFEWTDQQGRTRKRPEALAALAALSAELRDETDVETYHYGGVQAIASARPGVRLMRVWVLRPEGWRALSMIGTALTTGATPFAATDLAAGDCDNPCRTMPFTPTTDTERAIAGIFQQLKMDEWRPNPDRWALHVLDDVYYVTATARLSKADRVARLTRLKDTGAPSVPGDPVESMRIVDLGDSAVMLARHVPYRGGKPYSSVRVWAFRGGRWQLANTQQTVIAGAAAMAATP